MGLGLTQICELAPKNMSSIHVTAVRLLSISDLLEPKGTWWSALALRPTGGIRVTKPKQSIRTWVMPRSALTDVETSIGDDESSALPIIELMQRAGHEPDWASSEYEAER